MSKWKIIVSAVVIVAIFALVFVSPAGNIITDMSNIQLPSTEKIFSGLSTLINPLPSGAYFTFIANSDEHALDGRSFGIENGTVVFSGTFVTDIFVGNTAYDVSMDEATVSVQNFNGNVNFDPYGTAIVSGKATGVSVNDGVSVRPSGKEMSVKFEINPSEYFVGPIVENSMKISNVAGEIERTGDTNSVQNFEGQDIEIIPFIGNIKLSDGEIVFSGAAKLVKGSNFVWTG